MAGARKCCCDECLCPGDVKISADSTVEWITHTVSSGVITVVDHEGPCITYWVDSDAGDQTETGDGTELDPWININTVFADACIKHICTHQDSPDGCPKVKILTKGTIDYTVDGGSYNYGRNLIFEPWDVTTIEIGTSSNDSNILYGVRNAEGVIWKEVSISLSHDTTGTNYTAGAYGFYACDSSTFQNCTTNNDAASDPTYYLTAALSSTHGFNGCFSSVFDNCNTEGNAEGSAYYGLYAVAISMGFTGCLNSTFHNSITIDTASAAYTSGNSIAISSGFNSCETSTFDNCDSTSTSNGNYTNATAYGFSECDSSTLLNCDTISAATTINYTATTAIAHGFFDCNSSAFTSCAANATASSPATACEFACGFYSNTDSSCSSCTTSDKICNDCGSPCPWDCDI